jgi:hypothetical protein
MCTAQEAFLSGKNTQRGVDLSYFDMVDLPFLGLYKENQKKTTVQIKPPGYPSSG